MIWLQFPTVFGQVEESFSQLLNVLGVNDVRKTEIYTAEPVVLDSSAFEIEMAIGKVKGYKSSITDQIPAEMIKAEGRTISSEIHKLINYTGLFISPSGISELDCATTKTDMAERIISIGRESLQVFLY